MSTRPGSHIKKKPGQKHKNTTAFKFDKYRTDPIAKVLKNLEVTTVQNNENLYDFCCSGSELLSQVYLSVGVEDQVWKI